MSETTHGKTCETNTGNTHEKTWENNTGEPVEGFDRLVVLDLRQKPFEPACLGFVGQYLGF
jgi:hypothetical protein